ncbi:MAG: polyprenol phosphomannose-dependent alpha 1,6 mannosyltransferase MptB [Actinobacteria bacterium]|nr:polyprenol phosphomannose-dependent alpha 1,6 mannosyltransferase MptB [Actinomycetota bacterium]
MPSLIATLRDRWVWLGMLATTLVAWGSTHPEYSFAGYWPNDTVMTAAALIPIPLNRVLIGAGAAGLTWAWWRLRPTPANPGPPAAAVLALWSLPLLVVPPVLSPDAVLYADLGWMRLRGLDPYLLGLAGGGGPFAGQVDPLWAGSTVAYPPLAIVVQAAMVSLAGAHPYWSIVAMRIPVLLALAAMLWLIPRIAAELRGSVDSSRRVPLVGTSRGGAVPAPRVAVWLGVLNPLVVLHFVGGAHNDAPMVAVTLLAIWLVLRVPADWMSLLLAPAVVGVAMALKQQGGLAVIAVAGLPVAAALAASPLPRRLWLLGWRTAIATAVTVATFAAICLGTGLGFGWVAGLDLMGRAPTPAPLALLSKGAAAIASWSGGDAEAVLAVAGLIGTAVLLVVLGWVVVTFADRPLAAVAWGSFALAVLGQALHPWYLPWSLALLALIPLTRRQCRWVYGSAVGFANWNAVQTAVWHGVIR